MSFVFAVGGWLLAVAALGAAVTARSQMARLTLALARACHEVRGPLTAARLGLALAGRSGQLPDLRLRATDLELGQATLALEDLTEAWQRRSMASDADALADGEQVDLAQLLAESTEAWRAVAAARNVELRLVSPERRVVVRGQRLRLAQAITNLIANAIEHGGGVVEVSCRVEAAHVTVEIRDEGAGVPAPLPELGQPRVTRSRWQLRYRNVSRRGHGLAVAGAVAAAHHGRLAAAPCDRGVRMLLELPVAGSAGAGRRGAPVRSERYFRSAAWLWDRSRSILRSRSENPTRSIATTPGGATDAAGH